MTPERLRQYLSVLRREAVSSEEADFALAGTMLRVEQIQHNFGFGHFSRIHNRQFRFPDSSTSWTSYGVRA